MNDLRQLREMSTLDLFQRAMGLLSEVQARPVQAAPPAPERRRGLGLGGWRRRQPNRTDAIDTFTTQAQLRVAYGALLRADSGSNAAAETAFRDKLIRTIQAAAS